VLIVEVFVPLLMTLLILLVEVGSTLMELLEVASDEVTLVGTVTALEEVDEVVVLVDVVVV
jgi:hypothetical protein